MKFKEIEEGKLYQDRDNANVYTKLEGLLYHVGYITEGQFEIDMYYVQYSPSFILNMNFHEIKLKRGAKTNLNAVTTLTLN